MATVTLTLDQLHTLLPEAARHLLERRALNEARLAGGWVPREKLADIRHSARMDAERFTRELIADIQYLANRPDAERTTPRTLDELVAAAR